MKLSLLKLTVLCFLVLTTTAHSQQQGLFFNFFGGGARSEGMGQAYIALSDDATAGGWNPAGLYSHERTIMNFSYGFLIPRGDYQFYVTSQRQLDYNHEGNVGGINNWSIITPMRIQGHPFVFNISTTRYFDVYYRFGEKLFSWSDLDIDDPADDADPNSLMQKRGGINGVNLGFGTRLYGHLAAGVMANIYYGSVTTEELRDVRSDITVQDQPYLIEAQSQVLDSTAYNGFNVTLGLLYDAEKYRVGLMARMPFTLKGETDSTMIMTSTGNGVEIDLVASPFQTQTVYVDNQTSKIDIPLMLGFGLAYDLKENWIVAGDIEYRGFEGKKVQILESIKYTASGDKEEVYSTFDPNWSNVWSLRLGTEYVFDTEFGEIPVRFGARKETFPEGTIISYDVLYEGPKPVSPSTNDSTRVYYDFNYQDNTTRGYSISFGTGIHWDQILLDVGYTYSNYEQGIWLTETRIRSKNIWKNHHLNLSFTGYF